MNKKMRNFFIAVMLMMISFAAMFAVSELVLKYTLFKFEHYPKSPGPGIPYVIESLEFKHEYITNTDELRGPEIEPKRDGEFRIMALGDSFTFGLGVEYEETHPKVLEQYLKRVNPRVHVVNAGSGIAVKERLEFLKDAGLSMKPDWVVLQIYIGNDFYDTERHLHQDDRIVPSLVKAQDEPSFLVRALNQFKVWIRSKSYVAKLLWHAMVRWDVTSDWLYSMNLRHSDRAIFLKEYPKYEADLIQKHMQFVGELHVLLKSKGIGLTVFSVPTYQQLFESHLLDPHKYDVKKPNQMIGRFCKNRDIPYIDFLEEFSRRNRQEVKEFYYKQDMHWTPAGHAFVGRFLSQWFLRQFNW